MTSQSPRTNGNTPSWDAIFDRYGIHEHDFDYGPYEISAADIKVACQHFTRTSEKEVRILCKQDTRESRPRIFREKGLFILPIRNGNYAIVKGEGYADVPTIQSPLQEYSSKFPFELETAQVGDSEMQYLDRAYALSLIRHFANDDSLVLTIRGRKRTPRFDFVTGEFHISVRGVQTEVDAGYEGQDQVVLIEAKGSNATNTIIRQLYYPFRQWQQHTTKPVSTLFFQRKGGEYHLWHFGFDNPDDYNSIRLLNSARYKITRAGG
ncbi:MAG: hypothetical protein F4W95_09925 [Chloroflexi bacterium]|nr:hypothetical protein [Chloroflexota bacterium]MYD48788.1 hypothetical protein [Chloroflexota bacterium]